MTEPQAKKKAGCGNVVAIGAVVLVGLYLLGSNESAKKDVAQKQALVSGEALNVTPEELRAAYASNEVAAQQIYGDKVLRIEGIVHEVTLNLTNEPVIALETSDPYSQARVFLTADTANAAASLSKGQKASFRCTDTNEMMGLPVLLKCIPSR